MGDIVGKIMRYEDGEMEEHERHEFLQELIDSGLYQQLQGSYGRDADRAIRAGYCTPRAYAAG